MGERSSGEEVEVVLIEGFGYKKRAPEWTRATQGKNRYLLVEESYGTFGFFSQRLEEDEWHMTLSKGLVRKRPAMSKYEKNDNSLGAHPFPILTRKSHFLTTYLMDCAKVERLTELQTANPRPIVVTQIPVVSPFVHRYESRRSDLICFSLECTIISIVIKSKMPLNAVS